MRQVVWKLGDWEGAGQGVSLVGKQVDKETKGGQRPPWDSSFWKILVVRLKDGCGWEGEGK